MEYGNYAKEQKNEENVFNDADHYIKVATNKKPNIEVLKYSERTASSMKITAMATDGDGENLTYKLYVGATRENLVEQLDIKENVEQGTEVSWTALVTDNTSTYYYKIVVSDKYADIDSGIRETNNAPVLGEINLTKDLDETIGNWVKITTSATDKENDKLTYAFKMWKKEEGANEEELIQQAPTKIHTKENVNAGEEVELIINGLEEYQDYVYRVDIADKDNDTIGIKENVKTYCSGKGIECERWRNMY